MVQRLFILAAPTPYSYIGLTSLRKIGSLRMTASIPSSSSSPPAKRLRQSLSPSAAYRSINTTSHTSMAVSNSSSRGTEGSTGIVAPPLPGQTEKEQRATEKRQSNRLKSKRKDRKKALDKMGEDPIYYDICDLLGTEVVVQLEAGGERSVWAERFGKGEELTLVIERLSSHGEGLAIAPSRDWVIAVPHCLPGEKVHARVFGNERMYSRADLVRVLERSTDGSQKVTRKEELIGCKYFGQCSGCQYQMIDYETQLDLKKNVVARAFLNYSKLNKGQLPDVLPTLPSPLQYNYRTKLTPHFELPNWVRKQKRGGNNSNDDSSLLNGGDLDIGFDKMGGKNVLDIEECPIATKTINTALPIERKRIKDTIGSFKNGATLLLRDSLCSFDSSAEDRSIEQVPETETITNHKAVVKERVGEIKFDTPAGAFFQNNRSILPSLLAYVREQVEHFTDKEQDNYLVDAYCGSGLFAISLSKLFKKVAGVEISQDSIRFAKQNVTLNGLDNVEFLAGDAQEIFKHIEFPSKQTTVIIDPSRRGCDENFIKQLLALAPRLIVYVSCNVHTQARDVGQMMRGAEGKYMIKSIRGADLFPQTYHVEGVCVLERVDG